MIATMTISVLPAIRGFRSSAVNVTLQKELEFKKPSAWKNNYELHEGKTTLGTAHPPKKLKKDFEIDIDGQVYHLSPGKGRSWSLKNDQGTGICEISPRGGLKRGANLEVTNPTSIHLLVFVYCLVLRRWQEESIDIDMD